MEEEIKEMEKHGELFARRLEKRICKKINSDFIVITRVELTKGERKKRPREGEEGDRAVDKDKGERICVQCSLW